MDERGAVGSLFRFNLLKSTLINLYMLRGYCTVIVGDACLHCNVYTGIFCCCEAAREVDPLPLLFPPPPDWSPRPRRVQVGPRVCARGADQPSQRPSISLSCPRYPSQVLPQDEKEDDQDEENEDCVNAAAIVCCWPQ